MTDKELLEMAAKAAGVKIKKMTSHIPPAAILIGGGMFDPISNDGDALRLAVKLNIGISFGIHASQVNCDIYDWGEEEFLVEVDEDGRKDPYAATRRAIVRAAAKIGKGMK